MVIYILNIDTAISTIIVAVMLAMIPLFSLIVWKNKHVKDLLFSGWTPIIFAMVISRLDCLVFIITCVSHPFL